MGGPEWRNLLWKQTSPLGLLASVEVTKGDPLLKIVMIGSQLTSLSLQT